MNPIRYGRKQKSYWIGYFLGRLQVENGGKYAVYETSEVTYKSWQRNIFFSISALQSFVKIS